jgi:SAM-dependent methyltransferase
MDLELLKENWEAFGDQDPLWAILTVPDRRGGRWDLDEFLQTGETEIAGVLDELAAFGVRVRPGRALDFGCGVGRLTQALAGRFERSDGVDIATSMVEEARRINRFGDRVQYHLNAGDLSLFESQSFDLVLSIIVLQHMEPEYAARYIAEFVRVLKVGGIAVFQLPTGRPVTATALVPDAFRATLILAGDAPGTLATNEAAPVDLRVRNDSSVTWPTSALLTVGGRWHTGAGAFAGDHDIRVLLPAALGPGEEQAVQLGIRAPATPGDYRLELDLLHEPGGWFSEHGSSPLALTIDVTGGQDSTPTVDEPAPQGRQPVMEMHGMAPELVGDTLEAAGAELVVELEDIHGGPLIESRRYIARRVTDRGPAHSLPALAALDQALAAIPARADMFPPVFSRRSGVAGRLEQRVRRGLGRALRSLTWVQAEHNRAVQRALLDVRAGFADQERELRRLRQELARERTRGTGE